MREEDGDPAALEVRRLSGPVDVGEAQRDVAGPVETVPAGEVLLGGELRDAVGRHGTSRRVLARGPVALAVDRAAGGAEHDLGAVRAGRLENGDRAHHVDV